MGRYYSGDIFKKTLLDVEKEVFVEKWSISSDDLGMREGGWMIEKRRLYGGLSDHVDIVEVNNGSLSFILVPTRGMGVWKGSFKGYYLGWNSPVKTPVHPSLINLESRGGLGWLDGFNEWIVRCGLSSLGAPGMDVITDNMGRGREIKLTLHGKIANIPAERLEVTVGLNEPYEIRVEGVVYERSMFGSNLKLYSSAITYPNSNILRIIDSVENLKSIDDEMQLLYHCNFGPPFLGDGSTLLAPVELVAPRDSIAADGIEEFNMFGPPKPGFIEQVYFLKLRGDSDGRTSVMLLNSDETLAVSLSFSLNELPYFTLWKNTGSLEDGYVVGLEPGTSLPNNKAFERERGRIILLRPSEKYQSSIDVSIHVGREEVDRMKRRIEGLGAESKMKVLTEPSEEFSPSYKRKHHIRLSS